MHFNAAPSDYCETCGQLIEAPLPYGARNRNSKRIGIAISILLHLLVVLYYLTRSETERHAAPPAREGTLVYIAPLPDKPKPKSQPKQKPELAKVKPAPARPKRALASITPPVRPKQEVYIPPVVAPMTPPPPQDMQAQIAAKRQARADAQPQAAPVEAQESDEARGQRIARANIAGAQGRSAGNDKNDTGGVFSILNQTYHSADVKFRGWNGNFKRNWTQQVRVDQGGELDIETAIVKKMIELIRKEKPGDFVWDSHRLGRHVNLSARVEDTAELQAFLLKEFFPEYRPHAR